MGKLTCHHDAGLTPLLHTECLPERHEGASLPQRVVGEEVCLTVEDRIGAHLTGKARHTIHIGAGGGGGVADGRVGAVGEDGPTEIGIDEEVLLLRIREALVPACQREGGEGGPVGDAEDDVLDRLGGLMDDRPAGQRHKHRHSQDEAAHDREVK